jgi:hypothetical protein
MLRNVCGCAGDRIASRSFPDVIFEVTDILG